MNSMSTTLPYGISTAHHLSIWTGWGWLDQTHIIERFLTHLFNCSSYLSEPLLGLPPGCRLHTYIARVLSLSRTHLTDFAWPAVLFLNRIKERHPEKAYPTTGHRMFFAALMLSAKLFSDFAPNRWVEWGQGIPQRGLFQAERELCADLDWDFGITGGQLASFVECVCRDFGVEREACLMDVPWPFRTTMRRPGVARPQATVEWDAVADWHSRRRRVNPRLPAGNPPLSTTVQAQAALPMQVQYYHPTVASAYSQPYGYVYPCVPYQSYLPVWVR